MTPAEQARKDVEELAGHCTRYERETCIGREAPRSGWCHRCIRYQEGIARLTPVYERAQAADEMEHELDSRQSFDRAINESTNAMMREALGSEMYSRLWGYELERLGEACDALRERAERAEADLRLLRSLLDQTEVREVQRVRERDDAEAKIVQLERAHHEQTLRREDVEAELAKSDQALREAIASLCSSEAELAAVDNVLARRDALDSIPDRFGKITHAIYAAKAAEAELEQERRNVQAALFQRDVSEETWKQAEAEVARMKTRPVEAEYARLDSMWQSLVVERDEAKREVMRLRAENSGSNLRKGWLAPEPARKLADALSQFRFARIYRTRDDKWCDEYLLACHEADALLADPAVQAILKKE
jgi:hypothetical protein